MDKPNRHVRFKKITNVFLKKFAVTKAEKEHRSCFFYSSFETEVSALRFLPIIHQQFSDIICSQNTVATYLTTIKVGTLIP